MATNQGNGAVLTSWMTWGSLLASLAIYLVVLVQVTGTQEFVAPEDEKVTTITVAFGITALGLAGAALWFRKLLFFRKYESREFASNSQLQGSYFTTCIMSWAMAEAIGILGFVLSFLTHDLNYFYAFSVPSVLLFVAFRPRLSQLLREYTPPQQPDSGAAW